MAFTQGGDAVEILIGTDPERKTYYELEVNPNNDKMLAQMTYMGVSEKGVILKINLVEEQNCFFVSKVTKSDMGRVFPLSRNYLCVSCPLP